MTSFLFFQNHLIWNPSFAYFTTGFSCTNHLKPWWLAITQQCYQSYDPQRVYFAWCKMQLYSNVNRRCLKSWDFVWVMSFLPISHAFAAESWPSQVAPKWPHVNTSLYQEPPTTCVLLMLHTKTNVMALGLLAWAPIRHLWCRISLIRLHTTGEQLAI